MFLDQKRCGRFLVETMVLKSHKLARPLNHDDKTDLLQLAAKLRQISLAVIVVI